MPPRIALLDASHGNPDTRRNFRREIDADLVEFAVTEGQLPSTFEFDGVVVTGSRASVYWDEPWINEMRTWVREAIDRGLPTLGICWGHQLLADALGGTVEPMEKYELGYREVEHDGGEFFEGVPERFTVFTTHSDAVTELPPNGELLAENDYGVHSFRVGSVFGVQAHPEYDPATAERIVRGKDLPEKRIENVCAGITEEAYEAAKPAKRVFENFRRIVERETPVAAG